MPADSEGKDVDVMTRIDELVAALQRKEDEKHKNMILWVLAILGAVAAVAGIAYAVYRYMTPDYLEDFDDDFDDEDIAVEKNVAGDSDSAE